MWRFIERHPWFTGIIIIIILSFICDIVKIIGKGALDMDVHPHTLRHSFAIHFLNSTNNLAKLKQLLGHSTIRSTEHYLKYTVEDIREEYTEAFR